MTEFGLIDFAARLFADVDRHGWEAIGDDCTVLDIGGGEVVALTTDMLVEGVHFLRGATPARELGRKALAVNLSDVAAMGLRPVATLLSVALPHGAEQEWAREFIEGYSELSHREGVALVGGDTTSSKEGIAINVVAIGRGAAAHVKRRSAACVGDVVFVAGELGGSALGLDDILAGRYDAPYAVLHRNPEAQTAEGAWLGGRSEVHAMMDLSDGLASDLVHILRASSCGAVIDVENIPAAGGNVRAAVCGGEDYKLLLTASAEGAEALQRDFHETFGRELYRVGRIVASEPRIQWRERGVDIDPDWHGFVHF